MAVIPARILEDVPKGLDGHRCLHHIFDAKVWHATQEECDQYDDHLDAKAMEKE